MNFEFDFIEKLTKIIIDNGLTEISLNDGAKSVTIKKEVSTSYVAPAVPLQASTVEVSDSDLKVEKDAHKGNAILSPMVGTFYSSASAETEAFVKVGDVVSAGDVVCIVEAMKLMNEIESEFSGKVVEICVKDGQAVEYGQPLMYVE